MPRRPTHHDVTTALCSLTRATVRAISHPTGENPTDSFLRSLSEATLTLIADGGLVGTRDENPRSQASCVVTAAALGQIATLLRLPRAAGEAQLGDALPRLTCLAANERARRRGFYDGLPAPPPESLLYVRPLEIECSLLVWDETIH